MQLAGNFKPSCAEMLDHLLFAKAQQLKTSIQLTQRLRITYFRLILREENLASWVGSISRIRLAELFRRIFGGRKFEYG